MEIFRINSNTTRKVCNSYSNTFNVFNVILFLVTPTLESLTHPHTLYYSNELWICIVHVKPHFYCVIIWLLYGRAGLKEGGWEDPGCGGLIRGKRGSQMGDGRFTLWHFSVALWKWKFFDILFVYIIYTWYIRYDGACETCTIKGQTWAVSISTN